MMTENISSAPESWMKELRNSEILLKIVDIKLLYRSLKDGKELIMHICRKGYFMERK
jgi:hypothetical protein